jgi:hypothetical protein
VNTVSLVGLVALLAAGCGGTAGNSGAATGAPTPEAVRWKSARCLANTGCAVAAIEPPPCAEQGSTRTIDEILTSGAALLTERVRIRGRLWVSDSACTAGYCPGDCCNECWAWLLVGDDARLGGKSVLLKGTACRGDDSLVCCRTHAAGQDVVVEGTLLRGGPVLQQGRIIGDPKEPRVPYALDGATICAISASAPR